MAAEIDRLRTALAEESRQRNLLQENLKRVFMRGVCALNFEAMSLLSDGAVPEQPMTNSLSFSATPGSGPGTFDWTTLEPGASAPTSAPVTCAAAAQPLAQGERGLPSWPPAQATVAAPTPATVTSSNCAAAAHPSQLLAQGERGSPNWPPAQAQPAQPPQSPTVVVVVPSQEASPTPDEARLPPAPLPFVTYTGPSSAAAAPGAPTVPRSAAVPPKGHRWQPAPGPRAAAAVG